MAKRYIDVDELLKTARDGYHSDFGRSMADLTSLREVIEDTPTADVVEVVRCSECKYNPNYKRAKGMVWCRKFREDVRSEACINSTLHSLRRKGELT